jgi:hypothetical protein
MAGLALIIVSANTFAILQAIDGIALKRQCILVHAASAAREEKLSPFELQKELGGQISINSMLLILQGKVRVIFRVAIAASVILSRGLYRK